MDTSVIIIIGVYALLLFVLPTLGANSAFKKNRRKMGIAIIATSILGIGWILAIVAFVQPYKLVEKEISNPCPKCNSTKGDELQTLIDRHTQKPTTSLAQAIFWGLFAIVLIGGSLWMAIMLWKELDFIGLILAGIPILAIGISLGRIGVMAVLDYQKAERVQGTIFHCSQCKHEWVSISG